MTLDFPTIEFKEELGEGVGTLVISGIKLTRTFLDKIWAKFKKYFLLRSYHLDVTCTFKMSEGSIECHMFANYAYAEKASIDPRCLGERFRQTFSLWVAEFRQLLEAIADDNEFVQKDNEFVEDYSDRLVRIAYRYMPYVPKRIRMAATA